MATPKEPTAADKKKVLDFLTAREFDPAEEIHQPPPLVTIRGKTILTEQNFITISGLPKSRKTTFLNLFLAAAVKQSEVFNVNITLNKSDKIVLIDTEQSKSDFSRQYKYLKNVCYPDNPANRLKCYLFRRDEPATIIKAIEQILLIDTPKIICIDNLTEMVNDINNVIECKALIQFLKKITDTHNIGVICLLHLNKGNNLTAGHLGSFADRGAQSVLRVELDKETQTSTLSATMLRSAAHFDPISIYFNDAKNRYEETDAAPAVTTKKRGFEVEAEHTPEDLKSRVKIIFEMQKEYSYAALVQATKKIFGRGDNAIKTKVLPYLQANKYIKQKEGLYYEN